MGMQFAQQLNEQPPNLCERARACLRKAATMMVAFHWNVKLPITQHQQVTTRFSRLATEESERTSAFPPRGHSAAAGATTSCRLV